MALPLPCLGGEKDGLAPSLWVEDPCLALAGRDNVSLSRVEYMRYISERFTGFFVSDLRLAKVASLVCGKDHTIGLFMA